MFKEKLKNLTRTNRMTLRVITKYSYSMNSLIKINYANADQMEIWKQSALNPDKK